MAGVRAGQVQGADAAVDEQQAMPAGLRRDAEHGTGAATDQAPLRGRPAAGSDPDRAAVLPFTAIRSSFGASVRPSGPLSPLTGEERRCCGQRPHRCRGIWRPPGRAFPVPGKKRTTTGARMPYAPSSSGPAGSTGRASRSRCAARPQPSSAIWRSSMRSWAGDVQVDPRRRAISGKRRSLRQRLPVAVSLAAHVGFAGQYSAGLAVPSQQPAGGSGPSGRACGLCTSRRP